MKYFFFLFLQTESLLEELSAVRCVMPNNSTKLCMDSKVLLQALEKIQRELYDRLSSKTDHAVLQAVLQAALLKPSLALVPGVKPP